MMNPQTEPLHLDNTMATETAATEMETLASNGFSQDEIVSLLWLRQWYQNGGSDRIEVVRHLEFLKILVMNGKIEL